MTESRFGDSERFVFLKQTDGCYMYDKLEQFSPVRLTERLCEIVSMIMYEPSQFVREKEKWLFELNNLTDFIRENDDIDKDILCVLIDKWDMKEWLMRDMSCLINTITMK